ncbi:MAG: 2-oxoacid:acceptor oxidoreductase subunit alpha [Candidatus Rokubacteria bacterium]|nr:2-oxoacid:acceptor oxidoreductase subunit alpha [Candidatus Rokubacteria bacterium]
MTVARADAVLTGQHFFLGDHAFAEGALAAGCRFFGGYPITPSTEVAERLARRLPEVGGIFVQMEDELASMAAIVGASVAGARAMTATSGPGFSLMMENLGLAAMMEVPCVVVNVQRGGPSTGLPTLVGQADVMQARWGSHGDYEIVAYSPASPQECFDLTVKAFNTADQFRIPVLLMADEVVAHMTERVTIPPPEAIPHVERKRPGQGPGDNGFLPFKADDDLIPPMVHAGEGYRVHFTGLTHDERGYPVLTGPAHDRLVRRLVDKIRLKAWQIVEYEEYRVEDARVVVIAYGSTARSARRAVTLAREQGIPAGLLRPITLWPFPGERVRKLAERVSAFVVPELNLGQLSREVERFTSLPVLGVNHAGGAMMPPEPILDVIREARG